MIGILLASHGKMADGMKNSMEMILGVAENFDTVSLESGQDFEVFKAEVANKIRALNQGDGVLIFVDLFGASPFNASVFQYQILKEEGIDIRVMTGMNLNMVMETIVTRDDAVTLTELAERAIESGHDGIRDAIVTLIHGKHESENDDEDY